MGAPDKIKFALFALSNNICGFRGCNNKIVVPEYDHDSGSPYIAEAAHIKGEGKKAARYDPDYKEVNELENLILVCPRCHKKIDKNPEKYTVEILREMKREQEFGALYDNIPKITFSELHVAAHAISYHSNDKKLEENDLDRIEIHKKIEKNNFTDVVGSLLTDAISKSSYVQLYLSDQEKLDPGFPNRLTDRFKKQYGIFVKENSGDDLFYRMKYWIEREIDYGENDNILAIHTAAFVILCHLFCICEVFEK